MRIAKTKTPWILHQQCETIEDPSETDIHLPVAKFDLMINHGLQPGTPASANVVIKVNGNGDSEEQPVKKLLLIFLILSIVKELMKLF